MRQNIVFEVAIDEIAPRPRQGEGQCDRAGHQRGRAKKCRGATRQMRPRLAKSFSSYQDERNGCTDQQRYQQQSRFHRDAETESEQKPGDHCPRHRERAANQHRHAQKPERGPKIIGPEFERTKMVLGVKAGQNDRPNASASRKNRLPDSVSAPRPDKVHRQQDEAHPVKNGRPVANYPKNRREQDLEKRHVIIEDISILNEAARPRPDHMHVLRLVTVEAVTRHVHDLDGDHQHKKTRRRDELRRAGHGKVIGSSLSER